MSIILAAGNLVCSSGWVKLFKPVSTRLHKWVWQSGKTNLHGKSWKYEKSWKIEKWKRSSIPPCFCGISICKQYETCWAHGLTFLCLSWKQSAGQPLRRLHHGLRWFAPTQGQSFHIAFLGQVFEKPKLTSILSCTYIILLMEEIRLTTWNV